MKDNIISTGVTDLYRIKGDIIDAITIHGGLEVSYLNDMAMFANFKLPYVGKDRTLFQYWKDINSELQELNVDWTAFDAAIRPKPFLFVAVFEDVHTLINSEIQMLTVLKSPFTKMVKNTHSTGNVLDLDIPDDNGSLAYNVPEHWIL